MTKLDPVPGYVLKTSTIVGAKKKVFINVCVDEQIPAPEIEDIAEITRRVLNNEDWVVPIIVSQESQVTDKAGNPATVFDCCMNPKVLLLGAQDPGVKVLVNETCIELVEDATGYDLDRNFTIPKMKSKGQIQRTEFSPKDFQHRPKALDQILEGKPNLSPQPPHKQPSIQLNAGKEADKTKPVIELISESSSPGYQMSTYRRNWAGQEVKPSLEIEVTGRHNRLTISDQDLVCDELTIPVGAPISKAEAVYTKNDDTLHIFVWTGQLA